jgi:hypothetical protein
MSNDVQWTSVNNKVSITDEGACILLELGWDTLECSIMTEWGFPAKKQVPINITEINNDGCIFNITASNTTCGNDTITTCQIGSEVTMRIPKMLIDTCLCYDFVHWADTFGNIISTDPAYTFRPTSDTILIAMYERRSADYALTISQYPENIGNTTGEGIYQCGDTATLYAEVVEPCYKFLYWADKQGSLVSSANPVKIVLGSDSNLTAVFGKHNYFIHLEQSPSYIATLSSSSDYYCYGDTAIIEATSIMQCYTFSHWSNDEKDTISTDNPSKVIMLGDTALIAHFKQDSFYLLLNPEPADGGIVEPSGVYACNSKIKIKATPSKNNSFWYWADSKGNNIGVENPLSITLTSDSTIIGYFRQSQDTTPPPPSDTSKVHLQLAVSPDGMGTTTGQGYYSNGSTIQISATPFDTKCTYFVNWTNADGKIISTENPYSITLKSDTLLIANFRHEQYYLSVTTYPLPFGNIIGNGSGLYLCEDSINMTARPTDERYSFKCWTTQNLSDTVSRDSSLHFEMQNDTTLVAHFIVNDAVAEPHTIKVHIKPNPTTDIVYLTLDLENSGNLNITLTDLLGNELLFLYDEFAVAGEFEKHFSLKALPSGAYYLRIQQENEILLEKIVKK